MSTDPPAPLGEPDILEVDEGRSSEFEMTQSIRRRDLHDLGETFATALDPLKQILERMKDLNRTLDSSARQALRFNLYQLAVVVLSVCTLALLVAGYLSLKGSYEVLVGHTETLKTLEARVEGQALLLGQLKETAKSTENSVEAVRKEQDMAPHLSLVPETDPAKARRSPLKLLVVPPQRETLDTKAINIPLSPEVYQ
jgi:hypothetical protein